MDGHEVLTNACVNQDIILFVIHMDLMGQLWKLHIWNMWTIQVPITEMFSDAKNVNRDVIIAWVQLLV